MPVFAGFLEGLRMGGVKDNVIGLRLVLERVDACHLIVFIKRAPPISIRPKIEKSMKPASRGFEISQAPGPIPK